MPMSSSSSSSCHSPCAACKFQRRKCTQECIFAPYFPPDQPQKFTNVHRVYGASNVAKLLNELNSVHREDAVTSLAYEAEARLRDPVYGCVGFISILQNRLRQVQNDLYAAKKELAAYIGPQAMMIQPQPQHAAAADYNINTNMSMPMPMTMPMMGIPTGPSQGGGQLLIRDSHLQQQQMYEAQQQQELVRYNSSSRGFDPVSTLGRGGGFNNHQMSGNGNTSAMNNMSPSLGLGTFDQNVYQIHQPHQSPAQYHHPIEYHQLQAQILPHQQPQQLHHSHHKSVPDDG